MYWFRNDSISSLLPWAMTSLTWFFGGWLIATHGFNLKKNERIIFGFGIGLILYLSVLNLISRFIPASVSFVIPALVVLMAGLVYAKKSGSKLINLGGFDVWPVLLLWAGVFIYSLLIERGLVIFDDQYHLSSASLMAAGRIPPIYFLNANFNYSYHYGFDLIGATLMRHGGLFPWSAVDISKALIWSYSLVLVGYLLNQYLHSTWKSIIGTLIFSFLSGTRYLLLLLPNTLLKTMDSAISLMGSSSALNASFSQALFMKFTVIPGPPTPYLFGFYNGIYSSYHLFHTGEYTLTIAILVLIWLLSTRISSWKCLPILVSLWAHLSLTSESAYGLIALAIAPIFIYWKAISRAALPKSLNILSIALLISIPIAIFQGGAVTELIKDVIQGIRDTQPAAVTGATAASGLVALNWPPKVISGNFTGLSIFHPAQLLVGLLEIGPILFFLPAIIKWGFKKIRTEEWMSGAIILFILFGMLIPVFFSVGMLRNVIIRFAAYALVFAYILFILLLFNGELFTSKIKKYFALLCTILMSISGLVNFSTQLSAISNPVLSEKITNLDAKISSQVWGRLSQEDIVFDPNGLPGRAVELTGIATVIKPGHFYEIDLSKNLPTWDALYMNPSITGFLSNGYRYVYIDEIWWGGLNEAQRNSLSHDCVKSIAEALKDHRFRRLVDLADCKMTG